MLSRASRNEALVSIDHADRESDFGSRDLFMTGATAFQIFTRDVRPSAAPQTPDGLDKILPIDGVRQVGLRGGFSQGGGSPRRPAYDVVVGQRRRTP